MRRITFSVIALLVCCISFVYLFIGCTEKIEMETIIAPGVGGKFQLVNKDTRDTLIVGGDGIVLGSGTKFFSARIGECLKLDFTPNKTYSKYNFKVTYLLEDSTEIIRESNNFAYEYVLPRASLGIHTIEFSAASTEQIITSYAKVYLEVKE